MLSVIPWFFVVAGSLALIFKRRYGYYLVYVGGVLSILGFVWVYVPFIFSPIFAHLSVSGKLVLLAVVNISVLLSLIWCHINERKTSQVEFAA